MDSIRVWVVTSVYMCVKLRTNALLNIHGPSNWTNTPGPRAVCVYECVYMCVKLQTDALLNIHGPSNWANTPGP